MFFEFVLLFVAFLLLYLCWTATENGSRNFPRGPKGLPILGNLHQLGREPHKAFLELKKEHGDIFSIKLGSYKTVVLNSHKDIRDAFSSNVFSGRPLFPERLDRCGGCPSGLIFNTGQSWSEQRRFALKTLRDFGFGKKSMESIVQDEAKELIETFKKTEGQPIHTQNKFNAAVLNALWQIVTGQRYSHDDPVLQKLIERLTSTVKSGSVLAMYMFMPWLYRLRCKLPGNYIQMRKETHAKNMEFIRKAIKEHQESFQEDAPPRDFIDMYLAEMNKTTDPSSSFYKENGIRNLELSCLDLFLAGAETTSTTMSWMFLLLALHPDKQDKLFEEIQRVVGLSRLPQLNDRPSMPYTEAIICEVMRFSSLLPVAVMHATTEDVAWKNYLLPKGTVIMPNIYGAMRDPQVWENPEEFLPQRFLSDDGKTVQKREALMPFSTGKRICPGMSVALDELFLFTTCLFQAFRVQEDPNSEEKLKVDYYLASVRLPKPQNMVLVQRNPATM